MLITWTDEDRRIASKKGVVIFMLNTTRESLREMDRELPTDTHLIRYELNGEICIDAVRGPKKVEIFDQYYDKFKREGVDAKILEISNGFGRIKPKLYNSLNK